jgi:endonuclease/exonuclease/phosphatase family metal-dependent hydrolase
MILNNRPGCSPGCGFVKIIASLVLLAHCSQADLAAEPPKPPSSLVFCSYNVRNWLTMDRFENGKVTQNAGKSASEKQAVIQTLGAIAPDILGLSEIGTAEDLTEVQRLLKKKGLNLPHSELAQGADPNRRLGLLSRFPITARQSRANLSYQLDGKILLIQRGLLDVTIEPAPHFSIRCLGVHLKSKREVPEADQALMRRNEAALVRRHVDDILESDPSARLLLYGDFNDYPNESPIRAIQGSRTGLGYMEDLRLRDAHDECWTHFWDAADLYSRLDYLFVSRPLKPFIRTDQSFIFQSPEFSKASDHRPIVTTLRLPAAPASTGE